MSMRMWIVFPFALSACGGSFEAGHAATNALEERLQWARKKEEELRQQVMNLEIALARQEICHIRQEVDLVCHETNVDSTDPQLKKQREKLTSIIQNTPSCAPEAQEVLDQILALITQRSNEKSRG